MRSLHDAVEISVTPDRVWVWLTQMADHYRAWHPDHVSATWVSGSPNEVGSVLEVVEILGGRRERLRFELTAVNPPSRYAYRIRGSLGALLPGGAFAVEPVGDGSCFHATIDCRFPCIARLLFGRRIETLRRHMREEGENLKLMLEAGEPPAVGESDRAR